MKRNSFKYTATLLLVFILAAVSCKNAFSFSDHSVKLTIKKSNLAISATPLGHHDFTDEDVFENETEDETETTFNAALPVLNSACDIASLVFPPKQTLTFISAKSPLDVQHPLYLAICSFRI